MIMTSTTKNNSRGKAVFKEYVFGGPNILDTYDSRDPYCPENQYPAAKRKADISAGLNNFDAQFNGDKKPDSGAGSTADSRST